MPTTRSYERENGGVEGDAALHQHPREGDARKLYYNLILFSRVWSRSLAPLRPREV